MNITSSPTNHLNRTLLCVLLCFGFLTGVQGLTPLPDGCYPNFTTAEGCNALQSLTTGVGNTAVGWYSLFGNSIAFYNTAVGVGALAVKNVGSANTAVGTAALLLNTYGKRGGRK